MTSVQERLQLKRMALDKWSTREKLCLASAVSCSGDQNWMSVSRSLKMLCGANRPSDWFSQKSCAVQYGELLENVDHPKRKKRTASERDNQTAETPTESILRKLTEERITELQALITKGQEEYVKLWDDIVQVQGFSEPQLKEMWVKIEQEQEQKIIEQKKYAQWLKEREERKTELQKAWRPGAFQQGTSSQGIQQQQQQQQQQPQQQQQQLLTKPPQLNLNQKSEEMEVDDQNSKPGTSPLLTSLLKSPSPAPTSTAPIVHPTVTTPTNARITAPTITNLLTGNTTTAQIQSSATQLVSNQQFSIINMQPLTGPVPPVDHSQQVTPSPSQTAPTLSMLLENKNKESGIIDHSDTSQMEDIKTDSTSGEAMETEEDSGSPNKDDDQQLMEVFKGLIPDNIEELEDILTNNNAMILNPELLEEESILEGVESLMDDQDDINNKNSPLETEEESKTLEDKNSKNLPVSLDSNKIKDEVKEENESALDPHDPPKIEDSSGGGKTEIEIKTEIITDQESQEVKVSETVKNEKQDLKEDKEVKLVKVESSDDSSDNTCLQSLKDKIQEDIKTSTNEDSKEPSDDDIIMEELSEKNVSQQNISITESSVDDKKSDDPQSEKEQAEESPPIIIVSESKTENIKEANTKSTSESSDVIIIAEDDDSNEQKMETGEKDESNMKKSEVVKSPKKEIDDKKLTQIEESSALSADVSNTNPTSPQKSSKIDMDTTPAPAEMSTATITIIDTDEESLNGNTKEDKNNRNKRDYSRKKSDSLPEKKSEDTFDDNKQSLTIRKIKERDGSESPLVDEDNSDIIPRTRRRYSSTPVIDSIPSSPASSDDREYKAWKKSILMIYNRLITHKHASIFLRPITDDVAPNYKNIVFRPLDLQTIKKNVETGVTRTTSEFQRDIMLMCQNAMMYNKRGNVYNMAKEMMAESVSIIENIVETVNKRDLEKITSSSGVKPRGRKSHRLP